MISLFLLLCPLLNLGLPGLVPKHVAVSLQLKRRAQFASRRISIVCVCLRRRLQGETKDKEAMEALKGICRLIDGEKNVGVFDLGSTCVPGWYKRESPRASVGVRLT